MKQELDIFVVAYQRPEVLYFTLQSIFRYLEPSEMFNINLYIWINDYTEIDYEVREWAENYMPSHIKVRVYLMKENYGKAFALNTLYDLHSGPTHMVLTLDQDMVFKMPFIRIIEDAMRFRFDIMGFASESYWGHIPPRDQSSRITFDNYTIYYSMFIAGGIMLLPGSFLNGKRWTNEDGIYGGDDYNMCLLAEDKFVLEWNVDWLDHDPFGPNMPELQEYYAKKQIYMDKNLYVMPQGWYK